MSVSWMFSIVFSMHRYLKMWQYLKQTIAGVTKRIMFLLFGHKKNDWHVLCSCYALVESTNLWPILPWKENIFWSSKLFCFWYKKKNSADLKISSFRNIGRQKRYYDKGLTSTHNFSAVIVLKLGHVIYYKGVQVSLVIYVMHTFQTTLHVKRPRMIAT